LSSAKYDVGRLAGSSGASATEELTDPGAAPTESPDDAAAGTHRRRSAGIVRVAAFNLTYSIDLPRAPIAAVVDVSFDIFVFVRETAHGRFTTRARGLATRPGATNRPEVIATVVMVHPRRSLPLHSLRSHLSSVLTTELCQGMSEATEIRDVDERRQSRTHRGSPAKSDCQIGLRAATGNQSQSLRDYLLRELLGDA